MQLTIEFLDEFNFTQFSNLLFEVPSISTLWFAKNTQGKYDRQMKFKPDFKSEKHFRNSVCRSHDTKTKKQS